MSPAAPTTINHLNTLVAIAGDHARLLRVQGQNVSAALIEQSANNAADQIAMAINAKLPAAAPVVGKKG